MQENTVERLLLEKNEQGMDALLLHYGPLMRYIIAPILQIRRTGRIACPRSRCACGKDRAV